MSVRAAGAGRARRDRGARRGRRANASRTTTFARRRRTPRSRRTRSRCTTHDAVQGDRGNVAATRRTRRSGSAATRTIATAATKGGGEHRGYSALAAAVALRDASARVVPRRNQRGHRAARSTAAERAAKLIAAFEDAPARPLSQITMSVDAGNGTTDRVQLAMRGSSLNATIDAAGRARRADDDVARRRAGARAVEGRHRASSRCAFARRPARRRRRPRVAVAQLVGYERRNSRFERGNAWQHSRTASGRRTTAGNNSAISAEGRSSDHGQRRLRLPPTTNDRRHHVGASAQVAAPGGRAGQGSVSQAAHRAAAESGSDESDAGRSDGVGARAVLEPRAAAGDQHDAHRPAVGARRRCSARCRRRGDQHDRPHRGRGRQSGAGRRHERLRRR